jgi:hypothetical protein
LPWLECFLGVLLLMASCKTFWVHLVSNWRVSLVLCSLPFDSQLILGKQTPAGYHIVGEGMKLPVQK